MQRVNPNVNNGLWVIDSSLVTNIPLWLRILIEGETFYMWEISVPSARYCSEAKTAPKIKSIKKLFPSFSFYSLPLD